MAALTGHFPHNSAWRRVRRWIGPWKFKSVTLLIPALTLGIPRICIIAWLLRADPTWFQIEQFTRLLWLYGLLIPVLGLASIVGRGKAALLKTHRNWLAIRAGLAAFTFAALLPDRVDLAIIPSIGFAPIATSEQELNWRFLSDLLIAFATLAAVFMGSVWLTLAMFGVKFASMYLRGERRNFWARVEQLPAKGDYLISSHTSCAIGGG